MGLSRSIFGRLSHRLTAVQSMGAAALLMGISVFLSRIMGLVRDKVISWQFGAGADTDVYFAAFVVPDFINHLLAGGYVSMTLIPLLSGPFAAACTSTDRRTPDAPNTAVLTKQVQDGWDFFSAVISWNALAACLLTTVGFIFAPELARLTAPGFDDAQLARLSLYLRLILPGQVFFLVGACLTALLYVRKAFAVPALSPLIYNACIIAGGLVWPYLGPYLEPSLWAVLPQAGAALSAEGTGMTGYALGVSFGALTGAFLLPLAAAAAGGLRVRLRLYHPLLVRYVRLALPLMLGQSIVILDEQLVRIFGSLAGQGAVSLLNYARRIMLVPVGVIAQAAGVASFPFFAGLAARNDRAAFAATLNKALGKALLVALPVTACMVAVALPTLGLMFEGGRFGAAQTSGAAPLLRILLLSVPFWVVQQVIGRAFYAWQDTLTPAVIGTLVTLAVLPGYPLAARFFGTAGVAMMSAASLAVYALVLVVWWRRRFGAEAFTGLAHTLVPAVCLSILAAIIAGYGVELLTPYLALHLAPWTQAGITLGLSAAGASLIAALFAYGLSLAGGGLLFAAVYGAGYFWGMRKKPVPEK